MKSLSIGLFVCLAAGCGTSDSPADAADDGGALIDATTIIDAITDSITPTNPDITASITPDSGAPVIYSQPGPEKVVTTTATATLSSALVTVTIYLPSTTSGLHPAVFLSPGYGQPAAAYLPYAERLASFGVIVLLRDDPGVLVDTTTTAAQLEELVGTWLPAESAKASGPLAGRVDVSRIGLMGHSRGGQASLVAATTKLKGKVHSFFGLDAVDTAQGGATARAGLPGIGIPTAFLGETLDGTPIAGAAMACAPAADNYQQLYAAAPSPSLLLTAVGAAHFDFAVIAQTVGASFCHAGTADPTQVLAMAVTLSTGFFARDLLGAAAVGANLDGAGAAGYIGSGLLTRSQK